ncbi:hypothetical protein SteCoe_17105 [Stentor coeruleus]|uniref:Ubiquitin-like domain-containing protein n=1 Tax=Stentor coeruleus TaxID=5963 RepID=A0A1R2BZR5_9CILI|nr:hypothetical protein SteCoe_17105 [Stentor coeruleus]
MKVITELFWPFVLVRIITALYNKIKPNPQKIDPSTTPVFESGNIEINIVKGRNCETFSIDAKKTPLQIISQLYNPSELENKTVIFVCSGQRLKNDVAIGLQGVKNRSLVHTQVIDKCQEEDNKNNKSKNHLTLIYIAGLGIFWILYMTDPSYYSFVYKTVLVFLTERFVYFIFSDKK